MPAPARAFLFLDTPDMAGDDGVCNTKACRVCGITKPSSEFYRRRSDGDGLRSECKSCRSAANRARKDADPERYAATKRAWHEANRDSQLLKNKAWRETNKERHLASVKAWQTDNQERIAIARRKWRKENKHRHANTHKNWCGANPDLIRAYAAARRAMKLQATPSWANRDAIIEYYEDAVRLSAETGYAWHVDHIVPLKSKFVCGLHCEANLRVIPSIENQMKNNRWWPHMAIDGPRARRTSSASGAFQCNTAAYGGSIGQQT